MTPVRWGAARAGSLPPMSGSPVVRVTPVDLTEGNNGELAARIGWAWVAIRRGASATVLRDWLFGTNVDAMDQGQMDTLDLLAREPRWRMGDLAEALRVDPSTATRAVQRLVGAGFAERRASEEDGRVVHVVITEAGRAQHTVARQRRAHLLAYLLGSFEPQDRERVAEFFEHWVVAIDNFVAENAAPS